MGRWRRLAWGLALSLSLGLSACDRSEGSGERADRTGLRGGELVFEDTFDRDELGDDWRTESSAWRLSRGVVMVENARNAPLWLTVPLPDQVRVELDVTAQHSDGDLKFEIFADGVNHESGYILIYGGWSNSTTCIARLDEHGADRLDRETHTPVEQGRTYTFAAVRTDNRLRWYIDGEPVLTFDDADPLVGDGHRQLALNNWAVPAYFDNVRVYDLSQ